MADMTLVGLPTPSPPPLLAYLNFLLAVQSALALCISEMARAVHPFQPLKPHYKLEQHGLGQTLTPTQQQLATKDHRQRMGDMDIAHSFLTTLCEEPFTGVVTV